LPSLRRRENRRGPAHGLGHKKQTPGRLRAIALVENPYPAFAEQLLADRNAIERQFAQATNWGGGLTGLPPWCAPIGVSTAGCRRSWY
jgi:hypothetical protein